MPGDYLASILLGALAAILGLQAYHQYRRAVIASRWPTVPGRVTSAELLEGPVLGRVRRTTSHRAAVSYVYEVAGKQWTSSRVFFGDEAFIAGRGPERRADRYETGGAVQVYYNPEDPSQAVLEPRAAWRDSARRALTWAGLAALSVVVVYLTGARR